MSNLYNINGIAVNTGSGSITTGDINIGHFTQTMNDLSEIRKEFVEILSKLKKEVQDLGNEKAIEAISIIEEETKKEKWNKKIMAFSLDIVKNTAANLTANGLMTLASNAMSLLSLT